MNCDFTSVFSTISGRRAGDNEKLCAMEEKISPRAGLELVTARLVGQRLAHWATGAPGFTVQQCVRKIQMEWQKCRL